MQRTEIDPLLDPHVERDPIVQQMSQASGRTWPWVMGYGVVLLVAALVVLVNPLVAGVATGLVLGVTLFVYGVAAIASGWTSMSTRARWTELALGLIASLAGIFAILNPIAGAISLVWAIGIWLIVAGVLQISFALNSKNDRNWRLLLGVLDLVLGMVLLFSGALAGLAMLAMVVAISLTVRAIFLVRLAIELKKADA